MISAVDDGHVPSLLDLPISSSAELNLFTGDLAEVDEEGIMNKKAFSGSLITLLVLVILVAGVLLLNKNSAQVNTVGVIQPFEHIAVSDVTDGIRSSLEESGLEFELLVDNASQSNSSADQIAAKYRDRGVEVYVPIFTGTSQTVKSIVTDKPIVFAAVTDPVDAKLLEDPLHPDQNITGVSDLWPIRSNLELIKTIIPGKTRMGVLYDPSDPSSSVTMPLLVDECKRIGFEVVSKPVSGSADILQALSALTGKIDFLFTANDVTVTTSFPALVSYSIQNQIPLFAGDYSSVERGAIGAVGQNYYDVGKDAGDLVVQILQGRKISELPVVYASGGDVYINVQAAKLMGVKLDEELLSKAKQTYEEIKSN